MYMDNRLRMGLAALGVFVLVGCANNQPSQTEEPVSKGAAPTSGQASREPEAAPLRVAAPPKPLVEIVNPTAITFEKMSVVLDGKARETIALIADKARTSGKLTVTGYCDRNQIKNATDSAVARAVATRDELVAFGVSPASIAVKFNTAVAKKHAAEIKFEELDLTKKR